MSPIEINEDLKPKFGFPIVWLYDEIIAKHLTLPVVSVPYQPSKRLQVMVKHLPLPVVTGTFFMSTAGE